MTPELFGQPFTGMVSTREEPMEGEGAGATCECHHPQGWHRAGEGACLECGCLMFGALLETGATCQACGDPILHGTLCDSCAAENLHTVQEFLVAMHGPGRE